MKTNFLLYIGLALVTASCKEKMSEDEISHIGILQHKAIASYITEQHFNPTKSALSSSYKNAKGIVLLEMGNSANDSIHTWQHPTWSKYGYMGAITSDEQGNAYTAPIPVVNTLDNPLSIINRVFKISGTTGDMSVFAVLPKPDSVAGVVPFGVLGSYFDPHGQKLYVSSVAGSTRDDEKGIIYCLDPSGNIVHQTTGIDAMSLFVGGITGEKRLYYGSARTSDIFSIELDKEGDFIGKPKPEFSLEGLGPRGDDKARRMRFDKSGTLNIVGVEFNYNLTANSVVAESMYQFGYNKEEKKWVFLSVN